MTWTMYDSIDTKEIPSHAQAVAGYVGGHWPTYLELRREFPHAHVLSIAVTAEETAHCLDVENGDATVEDASAWVHRAHLRGIPQPVLYTNRDNMHPLVYELRKSGIHRSAVRLWSAHYTDHPHVCGPHTCGFTGVMIDGTQWTSHGFGRNLDVSLLHHWFFPSL